MNLSKLNPWNWFKHEEGDNYHASQIPVNKERAGLGALSRPGDRSAITKPGIDSLVRLHRQFEQMFDDLWMGFGLTTPGTSLVKDILPMSAQPAGTLLGDFRAALDVSGDDKQYLIRLDVPGFSESELSIDNQDNVITIKGHKEVEQESKDKQYYRVERSYGSFQRTLAIPDDGDINSIHAALKDGVLNITIPRREMEAKDSRKIPISSH
jgi:HSP20 family protein